MPPTSGGPRRAAGPGRLFRAEAIEHHRAADDAVVLPHYATLAVRLSVWALIILLLLAAGFAFTASVPRYLSGHATVVENAGGSFVELSLPAAVSAQVHPGETLSVAWDGSTQTVVLPIADVRPPGSPAGAPGCLPAAGTAPAADVVTAVAPLPAAGSPPAGGTGEGAVEVGRQPFVSWVLS